MQESPRLRDFAKVTPKDQEIVLNLWLLYATYVDP